MLTWQLVRSRLLSPSSTYMPLGHKTNFNKLSSVSAASEDISSRTTYPMEFGIQSAVDHVAKHPGHRMDHVDIRNTHSSCSVKHADVRVEGAYIPSHHRFDTHSQNLPVGTFSKLPSQIEALHLFEQLQQEGIIPEKHTLIYVLMQCGNQKGLSDGKQLHARIANSRFRSDSIINTTLITMYGRHSSLEDASHIFDQMSQRDVVAWSTFIALLARQGNPLGALQFCNQMLQEGVMPDKVALICILDAHSYASEEQRTRIHAYALFNMQEDDVAIGTALLGMFGKSNNLTMALQVFDRMPVRNVFTWSATISLLVQHSQSARALQVFNDMQEQGILPNEITFLSIVSAYTSQGDLAAGHRLHARLVGNVHEMGLSLSNSLLNLYSKCGSFQDAAFLFRSLSKVDVISFTAMIGLAVHHGDANGAFDFLNRMLSLGHVPDQVAFTSLIDACSTLSDLNVGQCVHAFIIECGHDSELILTNSLLSMYCKHGSLMEACWMFAKMVVRDTVSWNAMIDMHAQLEHRHEGLQLLAQMQQEVIPDKVTILNIMNCFTDLATLLHGKRLHTQVLAMKLDSEVRVSTSLVSMYGRCGSLCLAQRVFSELHEIDLVLWRELVMAYAGTGQATYAQSLFKRLFLECLIPDELCFVSLFSALCDHVVLLEAKHLHVHLINTSFVSDVSVNNALLNMYGKCGCLQDAQELFNRMVQRDSISWNTLLSLYNLHSQSHKVISIQDIMCWEGYLPDVVTWTSRLTACVSAIDSAEGKRVHACLHHCGLDTNSFIATALLSMYGKCGDLDVARRIFDTLPLKSLVSWNAMIAVYAQHGLGEEAIKLFDLMLSKRISPDNATFVSVLAACNHAGLHVEGCRLLDCMENHGLSPSADDFSCIIDLLGRLGRLDEAESLINAQLDNATVKSLRALLSACRHQRDVERGERAAEKVFHIDSDNAAAYVLLSNLYVLDHASIPRVAGQ